MTFFPLDVFYAHENAAFFVFVCLYAFLCLIKLIMILRVLTFTDKTWENKVLTSYVSLVYTNLQNVQSEDFSFLCFVSMCVFVCVCVKSFCKKNKQFKTALMTSFILLLGYSPVQERVRNLRQKFSIYTRLSYFNTGWNFSYNCNFFQLGIPSWNFNPGWKPPYNQPLRCLSRFWIRISKIRTN